MHSTSSRVKVPSAVVLPALDAEAVLEVVEQLLAAEEHARDVRAHVDEVVAHRLALEHLVERAGAEHLGRRDVDELGDVRHGVVGDVAVLLLGQVQQRDERRLRPRVAGDDLLGGDRVLARRGEPSAVDLAHDRVDARDDGDGVGDEAAAHHVRAASGG